MSPNIIPVYYFLIFNDIYAYFLNYFLDLNL